MLLRNWRKLLPKRFSMSSFENLLGLMDTLLSENGCPWDRQQTHESLRKNMIEEAAEAAHAIDSKNPEALTEELGDVLLQVLFHAKIAEKNGMFTIEDVIKKLSDKLVSRHTHVFGSDKAFTPEDALLVWKKNKRKEKYSQNKKFNE